MAAAPVDGAAVAFPGPWREEAPLPNRLALALLGLLATAAAARAEQGMQVDWLKADPAAKRVEFDVLAGFNANNSAWNYDGYHHGDATVTVPLGWQVKIDFHNQGGQVPHSLVIIADPHDPAKLPEKADRDNTAFRRAYTKSPTDGIGTNDKDTVTFTADKPGDYLWFCGVPGHGMGGMYVRFKVAEGIDQPSFTTANDAEPGRK